MRKRITLFVTAILIFAFLTGCGSSDTAAKSSESYVGASAMGNGMMAEEAAYYESDDLYDSPAEILEAPVAEEGASSAVTDEEIQKNGSNRKLIKTVNMSVQTKEFDKLIATIQERVEALGGYAENLNVSGYEYNASAQSTRYASICARIPAAKLDSFIVSVSENSNITSKNESVSDVTLQYADVEAHKQSLRVEQERLNELLLEADSIETIIALESRLSEVRYELESYESRLRTMDNQVEYSTVYIDISEVKDYTTISTIDKSFGQRLSEGFAEGCARAVEGLGDFVVGFVSVLPELLVVLVIVGIFGCVIFLIVKGFVSLGKRRKAKKAAKAYAKRQAVTEAASATESAKGTQSAEGDKANDK